MTEVKRMSSQDGQHDADPDRRKLLAAAAAVGAAAGMAGLGALWYVDERREGRAAERAESSARRTRYVDLSWVERPEVRVADAEVILFPGDPTAKGKQRKERTLIALIGIEQSQAYAQFDKGIRPAVVFWAPSPNLRRSLVAHVADLSSLENFGKTERLKEPLDPSAPDRTDTILTVGLTIGEGALSASILRWTADDKLIAAHGVRRMGPITPQKLGEHHTDIPVV